MQKARESSRVHSPHFDGVPIRYWSLLVAGVQSWLSQRLDLKGLTDAQEALTEEWDFARGVNLVNKRGARWASQGLASVGRTHILAVSIDRKSVV